MKRALLLALVACGGGGSSSPSTPTTPVSPMPSTVTEPTAPTATTPGSSDAPEISRSVGVEGGIVILWPRVRAKDSSSSQIASQIQARLVELAKRAAPGKSVDVRPEPERTCPRQGCKAIAIGAALMRNGEACAVVVHISGSGPSDATLVPWAGDMTLKSPVAAFREPPENQVQVRDYATCSSVVGDLAKRDKDVEAAIKIAAGL